MLEYMGTDIGLSLPENDMRETYVATPILTRSTVDDWVKMIAKRKGEKDLKKVAQGFLAPEDFKKWLKQHSKYSE